MLGKKKQKYILKVNVKILILSVKEVSTACRRNETSEIEIDIKILLLICCVVGQIKKSHFYFLPFYRTL